MAAAVATQARTTEFAKNSLRQKILKTALTSSEFLVLLEDAASEIRQIAARNENEATLEGAFERILYARLREIGLRFHPQKESSVNTKRHVTHGRMDSRLGALIIEYKRPALLSTEIERSIAIEQLKDYLIAVSEEGDEAVGFLTNGQIAIELRAQGGKVTSVSAPETLTGTTLARLTRQFVSLALTALTPTNLIRDFCGSETEGALFKTARILNSMLAQPQAKTQMLRSEWEEMFRLAHDDQSQQRRIIERRQALADLFAIKIDNAASEYRALFALHTAYAILLKFMAYRTVSDLYLGDAGQDYRSLATSANTPLRAFCEVLEDGEVFRSLGIINLLEGDFFSWYCDRKQWTAELADSIREAFGILARYEEAERIFEANDAPDLFRELYQAAVPRAVRSSFGEFYTPYWLAEHVLESAAPVAGWRVLDPCCGSGTFVVAAISRLRKECEAAGFDRERTLAEILSRVVAIDLNPLSVLTGRINYFIHISHLLGPQNDSLVIPVFLGDAASIPTRTAVSGVECFEFSLKTLRNPIDVRLPISLVRNTSAFMQLMLQYERHIRSQKRDAARALLLNAIPVEDRTLPVRRAAISLTDQLVDLEQNGWNGIWARILSNFLTTACLGEFDLIVGNPPWVDWKNLPEGYRNRIKDMCVERGLFSGAGRTGGINLNICALIAYVAMTNWLKADGRLAFLMPRELANQASYEGWRRLGGRWRFLAFHDWSKAGHPFDPVKEDFMTYVIGAETAGHFQVPVWQYHKIGRGDKATQWPNLQAATASLSVTKKTAGQVIPHSTAFTFADSAESLREFGLIAGESEYIGREGTQFYPQELLIFRYLSDGPRPGTAWMANVQVTKSQYKLPRGRMLLETRYLHPLVTAPTISPFKRTPEGLYVAFPYHEDDPIRPIDTDALRRESPLLYAFYVKNRETIGKLSKFNEKIRGKDSGAFYGLARTGPYTFADVHVAFRKDTKWCAVVVSEERVPWGGERRVMFQSHAVSMCERSDRSFIREDEAHYICAILNVPLVVQFIAASSDNRSFKVRPPLLIPLYDSHEEAHRALATLSRKAHKSPSVWSTLSVEAEAAYRKICLAERKDKELALAALSALAIEPKAMISGDALKEKMKLWQS